MNTSRSSLVALAFFAALAGCATRRAPEQSGGAAALAPAAWSAEAPEGAADARWIDSLGDPQLGALVAEALRANFGLEAALQRAKAAEAVARISGALKYPSLNVGLRSSRQKARLNLPDAPVSIEADTHALDLGARWEADLWSRVRQGHAAALAQYEATQLDFDALRLSLAGQVAKAWFGAVEAAAQLELAESSASSFERKLAALERRYRRGLLDAFDLRLARAQAASSRAAAEGRRAELGGARRSLETLLGRYPSAKLALAADLPEPSPTPSAGLPAELLARRPDLQAEERRLAAAFADERAASRNWLPSIVLSASAGNSSDRFEDLLDDNFNVWSLAAELAQPIFAGGRLAAERDQAAALRASQLSQYKNLALQAFREVETALQSERDLDALEAQTEIASVESAKADEQAWSLYERGLVDIGDALDAERRAFDARSQLLSIRNRRLQNRVDLHLALGGGFDEATPQL